MPAPDWILPDNFDPATLSFYAGFVYLITHIETGRAYVGRKYLKAKCKGKTVESDWRRYWSSSKELKAEFKANGHDGWKREILSFHRTKGEVNYAEVEEQFRRDVLNAKLPNGSPRYLNRNIMGRWFAAPETHTAETREKLSKALTGRKAPRTPEHQAKLANARRGKTHSEATKAKMSADRQGRKVSEETKAKLSTANSGRRLSEEHKAKIGAANKGRSKTPEQCRAISERNSNPSAETRAKCGASKIGKPLSEEHKAKIRAGLKKAYAEGRRC